MADVEWLNRESPMNQALIAQLYAGFVDRYARPTSRRRIARCASGWSRASTPTSPRRRRSRSRAGAR